MFTGIVERTADVLFLEDRPGGRRVRLRVENREGLPPWRPAALGESIAVDGVCLTVVEAAMLANGGAIAFDAVPETLGRTTLGELKVGDEVNIERSLRVGDSFGGHYVTGHIDGVGTVRSRRPEGDQVLFEIEIPLELTLQVIPKGSVALDGISLTVIDVDRAGRWFSFAAIPHTVERTILKRRRAGSRVNVETDAFGKWVLHALKECPPRP
jgi:riboflavin synthase alpha subunit